MASSWPVKAISDIATRIAMGPFGSNIKTDNFVESGVPVIRGNNLTSGRFDGTRFAFLTEQKADELKNSNAFPGDIVFTHRGSLGQVGIIPDEPFSRYVVSQSQMVMTCDRGQAEPLFIYYYFKSRIGQHALLMNTSQTGVPAISRPVTSLKSIRLPVPPLSVQRAIGDILGTLDNKIELNRMMSETLEALARAIFKSWFVDLDPVRAKADGRQPAGMDIETAALFPDSFIESPLGKIPAGWEVRRLGDICEFKYGKALKAGNRIPGPFPVYGSNGRIGWHVEALVKGPGIVVGRKGNPGIVIWVQTDFFPIDTAFFVTSSEVSLDYLFYALDNLDLASYAADSAVPGLGRNIAYMTDVLVAPAPIVDEFATIRRPLLDRVESNKKQNQVLIEIRDGLLPKLISGEVHVKDAEKFVEEHAG